MRSVLVAAMLAACIAAPVYPQKSTPSSFVGVWQAAPSMGAGWAETYRFFPNGRFRRHASQFDGETRLRAVAGRWSAKAGRLTLRIDEETVWIGGTRQPALGSVGTEYEIVGSKEETHIFEVPRVETHALTAPRTDPKNGRPSLLLGKKRFWRFSADPKRYP